MTDYKPSHTGLCGITGGYGYCTCGLDEYKAQLAKKEEQLRVAVERLREIENHYEGEIADKHMRAIATSALQQIATMDGVANGQ